ncbi:Uridine kinase [Alkalibacterium sp. AK22]|uniref:uridine kinase family protein n=1 Tax=Alkalibacterium sp. AK22 TaxID=1229520 RepID=UPI0004486454|nr:phosphoribulokinase [Alkalibacterium sp. AK22]EXJ23268.1 Uridine kinase [Alkalibacterium sp. AK22]
MDKLLQVVKERIGKPMEPFIIGVSGHGAAGKTTFTNKLVNLLGENKVNYLNTDPYIISSNVRQHTKIDYTYDNEPHRYKMTACHPAAHHVTSLKRDILMIRNGLELFTIGTHYMESERVSPNKKITIVEGMSVAFVDSSLFDVTIYFYTDGETEFQRRTSRDTVERGTTIEYLRQSHVERRAQYEIFMHPSSQNFDIIVKTVNDQILIERKNIVKNSRQT